MNEITHATHNQSAIIKCTIEITQLSLIRITWLRTVNCSQHIHQKHGSASAVWRPSLLSLLAFNLFCGFAVCPRLFSFFLSCPRVFSACFQRRTGWVWLATLRYRLLDEKAVESSVCLQCLEPRAAPCLFRVPRPGWVICGAATTQKLVPRSYFEYCSIDVRYFWPRCGNSAYAVCVAVIFCLSMAVTELGNSLNNNIPIPFLFFFINVIYIFLRGNYKVIVYGRCQCRSRKEFSGD